MSNPYLPKWEYIPDGEPRVFNDRVYIYGSHDMPASDGFCDYKLKVWSAPLDNLNDWVCHGDAFHTKADRDHPNDVPWTNNRLFAPDVVYKDGKYYLYAYIMDSLGCVAVSDKPEGPFKLVSQYKFNREKYKNDAYINIGWFIDPGVLVDDDGRVYLFCGYENSFAVELKQNMFEVKDETYVEHIIPREMPFNFFEAISPRKIGDKYYLIYAPRNSCLAYAISDKPLGPYKYGGIIVDNAQNYPGGNNHGSICNVNGQWYIFYHRMTNGTIMSRRACVEKINIEADGSIKQVEMTSLGFEKSLNPFKSTKAEIACYLTNNARITEKNIFSRVITDIKDGCIIGYKYFDFGNDYSTKTMQIVFNVLGQGCKSKIDIHIDSPDGEKIGSCFIGTDSGIYSTIVSKIEGIHAVFFKVSDVSKGYFKDMFLNRNLFELSEFVFIK